MARPPVRLVLLAVVAATVGCVETAAIVVGVGVAAVPVVGRTLGDVAISAISGKDCSLVRLDAGRSYCAPQEPAPARPVVCLRSLGVVDCYTNPEVLGGPYREMADGPRALTPEQEAHRTRRWPNLW